MTEVKKRPFICNGNFQVTVESSGRTHLEEALRMCFDKHSKATHYRTSKDELILYWHHGDGDMKELPYEMDYAAAVDFVWGWLKTADRGREPDHDGSNKADGFRVESAGYGCSYAVAKITAVWSEFHK